MGAACWDGQGKVEGTGPFAPSGRHAGPAQTSAWRSPPYPDTHSQFHSLHDRITTLNQSFYRKEKLKEENIADLAEFELTVLGSNTNIPVLWAVARIAGLPPPSRNTWESGSTQEAGAASQGQGDVSVS